MVVERERRGWFWPLHMGALRRTPTVSHPVLSSESREGAPWRWNVFGAHISLSQAATLSSSAAVPERPSLGWWPSDTHSSARSHLSVWEPEHQAWGAARDSPHVRPLPSPASCPCSSLLLLPPLVLGRDLSVLICERRVQPTCCAPAAHLPEGWGGPPQAPRDRWCCSGGATSTKLDRPGCPLHAGPTCIRSSRPQSLAPLIMSPFLKKFCSPALLGLPLHLPSPSPQGNMDSPLPTQIWAMSLEASAQVVRGSEGLRSVSASQPPTPYRPAPSWPDFPSLSDLTRSSLKTASQIHLWAPHRPEEAGKPVALPA